MVAEAILTFKNEGKCSFWASSLHNFACGACNGYVTVCFCFLFWGDRGPRPWGRGSNTYREIKNAPPCVVAVQQPTSGAQNASAMAELCLV
eukprot:2699810-Prymnesium_polylepis.1